jgi:murein DD-endopeptidase MepM/ murein hydrolase activator NlpD
MRRAHAAGFLIFFGLLVSCAVLALPTVLAVPAAAEADPPDWRWPVEGGRTVTRRFDPPARPWLAGHRGVDVAARAGAEIRAAGAGTVGFAGSVGGRGAVTIVHPGGLRTTYLPVRPTVRQGQAVAAGEMIGVLEHVTGHCRVACLHWGLLRGESYLDPLALFGSGQVRLLPRWGDHAPLRLALRVRSRVAQRAAERPWTPSAARPVSATTSSPSGLPGRHAVPAGAVAAFLVGILTGRRALRGRPGHRGDRRSSQARGWAWR